MSTQRPPSILSATQKTDEVDGLLQGYLDQLLVAEPFESNSSVAEEVSVEAVESAPLVTGQQQDTQVVDWRCSQGVECLLFKVAGLKMAIPLPLLGGVHNSQPQEVASLFAQAEWSLGLWRMDEQQLTIIDSAVLLMPERGKRLADEGYGFVIQLGRSPWALACQEICDTVTLVYDSIKWRSDHSKRPWLAGTVISEMCALIDVVQLTDLLQQQVMASR